MLIYSFTGDMNYYSLGRALADVVQRADFIGDNRHSSSVVDFQPSMSQDRHLVYQLPSKPAENIGPCDDLDRAVLVLQLKQSEPVAFLGSPNAQLPDDAAERHLVAMVALRESIDVRARKILKSSFVLGQWVSRDIETER